MQDQKSLHILQFRRDPKSIMDASERFITHRARDVLNEANHRQFVGTRGGNSSHISKCMICGFDEFEFYQTNGQWYPSDHTPTCTGSWAKEGDIMGIPGKKRKRKEDGDCKVLGFYRCDTKIMQID